MKVLLNLLSASSQSTWLQHNLQQAHKQHMDASFQVPQAGPAYLVPFSREPHHCFINSRLWTAHLHKQDACQDKKWCCSASAWLSITGGASTAILAED